MGRRDFDLSGATALVTGAGSGIGRAIALELARKGSNVLAVDQHPETAEKTALACTEVGPEAHFLTCDVTDPGSIDAVFSEIAKSWGELDFLVHAIAFSNKDELRGRYLDTTADNFQLTMNVSCYSLTAVAQRAVPLMKNGTPGSPWDMSAAYSSSGEPSMWNGPSTVAGVAAASNRWFIWTTSIDRPSTSEARMNSIRFSSLIWPRRIRSSKSRTMVRR